MDDITVMYYVMCFSYLEKIKEYKKTINLILSLVNDNIVENSKDHKHNPMSLAIDKVIFNEDKLILRYIVHHNQKGTSTVLFDYDERYRSFSLSTDKNEHIKSIKIHLTCELNFIIGYYEKNCLEILRRKEFTNNDLMFLKYKYDLSDIVHKKEHTNKNNFEYYVSVCPIYGFILKNNLMYISNQYELKYENGKLNIFYTYNVKKPFKRLLHRQNLKEFIERYNKNPKKITSENFMIIIENMAPIGTDWSCENEYGKTEYVLRNIDEPVQVITTIK